MAAVLHTAEKPEQFTSETLTFLTSYGSSVFNLSF